MRWLTVIATGVLLIAGFLWGFLGCHEGVTGRAEGNGRE